MKIKAKSSVDQVAKYALFAATQAQESGELPVGLVFMGVKASDFDGVLKSLEDCHSEAFELSDALVRHAKGLKVLPDAVLSGVRNAVIAVTTYTDFAQFLDSEMARIDRDAESGETLLNLLKGMRRFISAAHLV